MKTIKQMATIFATLLVITLMSMASVFGTTTFNEETLLVYGSQAAAKDVFGAIDIATTLQANAEVCETVETQTTNFVGDVVEISESSDLLEIGEALGSVKETLTEDDLEGLASDEIHTSEGTTDYNQYLKLEGDGFTGGRVVYEEDEDNVVGDFLYFEDGEPIFEYEMEFSQGLESEIESDDSLEDLENEDITILGQEYTIVEADLNGNEISLTLLGGAEEFHMEEGEVRTYDIDGISYEIEVLLISDEDDKDDREVVFKVNGIVVDELSEGDTEELEDGTLIGVREILNQEAGEGSDQVEGFIGANKLELEDDFTDSLFTTGIDVDDESIEDGLVQIKGFVNNDNFEITSIKYRLLADGKDGDLYVPAGQGLRQYLDEPEGLIGTVDLVYEGLDEVTVSEMVFKPKGDDEYELQFVNFNGLEYHMPLLSIDNLFESIDPLGYGDNNDRLVFREGLNESDFNIPENSYFILTDENTEDGVTRVIRYDSIDADDNEIDFNDLEAGSLEYSYEGTEGVDAAGEIIVGGNTFAFFVGPGPEYDLVIDLLGDGVIDGGQADVVIRGGGILSLGTTNPVDGTNFTLTTLASEFDDTTNGNEEIVFQIKVVGDELDANVIEGVETFSHDDNDDLESGMTSYGIYIEEEDDDNDADKIVVEYPLVQRGANVKVTMGVTDAVTTETVCEPYTGGIEHSPDSEVTGFNQRNLILVGGPCAYDSTHLVYGLFDQTCEKARETMAVGDHIVKLVENGDNVALLLYGYTAKDTQDAIQSYLLEGIPSDEEEETVEIEENITE